MIQWQVIRGETRVTHSPIALRLVDDFTGTGLIGDVNIAMEFEEGAEWRPVQVKSVRSNGGTHLYPGLGRAMDPVAQPSFRARIKISAENYFPAYEVIDDGLIYDIPTYNDASPPAMTPAMPEHIILLPGATYPFANYIRVVHGIIRDPAGDPVHLAEIAADGVERVISNEEGAFTLPLRWPPAVAIVNLVVNHARSGLGAVVNLNIPAALTGNQEIVIN